MNEVVSTFRELHDGSVLLRLANVWDAGSARLVQSLGAAAVATTSGGVAWSLGYPDGAQLPAATAVAAVERMARVLSVPLSVDVENGYSSDPATVAATIADLVGLGVAGINIEDGEDPPALLAEKITAIRTTLSAGGGDLFVNVRTDVYLRGLRPEGERVEEVLGRAKLYRDAGADGLFVPGLVAREEIAEVVAAAGLPCNVMQVPGLPSPDELRALGVRRLSAGTGIAQAAWGTAREAARAFLGTDTGVVNGAMSYADLQALFGPG